MEPWLKKVQSEVDAMNKTFSHDSEPEGTDHEPEVGDATTEAPSTDSPSTDAPTTDAATTDAPTTLAPTTDAPDERDLEITNLRAKLAEIESKAKPKEPDPPAEPELSDQDFIGDLDWDEVSADPKEFNKLLNKIYKQAVNDTRRVLGEGVLRSIPDIVKTNIATMASLQKASERFYEDNADLKPFKKVVASVFEELASTHPDKKYDELMKETAPEVRKRLELHNKAKGSNDKGGPPKLPRKSGKTGRPAEKPSTNPLQAELEEMTKTVWR